MRRMVESTPLTTTWERMDQNPSEFTGRHVQHDSSLRLKNTYYKQRGGDLAVVIHNLLNANITYNCKLHIKSIHFTWVMLWWSSFCPSWCPLWRSPGCHQTDLSGHGVWIHLVFSLFLWGTCSSRRRCSWNLPPFTERRHASGCSFELNATASMATCPQ